MAHKSMAGSLFRLSGLVAALGALALAISAVSAGAAEKVKFNMSWLPQGSIAGFVVALDKGLYKKAGLDVDLKRGYGGLRTVNEVAGGLFDFGYGAPQGIVLNRTKGGKTVMVGTINDALPMALCYNRAKVTIKTPRDLAGKKVGGGGFSPVQVILPILMDSSGVGRAKITMIKMKPAVIMPALLAGRTDVSDCWLGSNASIAKMLAKKRGVDLGISKLSDIFGLDVYGNGIITGRKVIDAKPGTVGKFVRTSYKGYSWMSKNMDAAVDLVVKRYPTLKRPIVLDQARAIDKLTKGPDFATKGYGWIDRAKMKRTRDFIIDGWNVKMDIPLDEIYTNKYLAGPPIM